MIEENNDTEDKKKGRPLKYKPEYAEQAYNLCLLGATDAQMSDYFEVNIDTVSEWKKKYPEFFQKIKDGKLKADAEVAAALYKRAIGFSYDEITYEKLATKIDGVEQEDKDDIKVELYKKKVVTKMVIPDTGAIMNWLKNRQREIWRENDNADNNALFMEMFRKLQAINNEAAITDID